MVIGNGLVARRFGSYNNQDNFIVFASGVSNSKTRNPEAYLREIILLEDYVAKNSDKTLVYFSTCSVYDPLERKSAYVQHKLQIEDYIKSNVKHYHIFRVSNLAGNSSNPNTLLNFFLYHVKNGINFDVWANACRNIIDIDDAYLIIDHLLRNNLFPNQVINIANPGNHPVKNMIETIEGFLNIKSNYIEIDKGACFEIDTTPIQPVIQELGIRFDEGYLVKMLEKFYQPGRKGF